MTRITHFLVGPMGIALCLNAEAATRFTCSNHNTWLEDHVLIYDLELNNDASMSYFDSNAWHYLTCSRVEEDQGNTQFRNRCSGWVGASRFTEILIETKDHGKSYLAYQSLHDQDSNQMIQWTYSCVNY